MRTQGTGVMASAPPEQVSARTGGPRGAGSASVQEAVPWMEESTLATGKGTEDLAGG